MSDRSPSGFNAIQLRALIEKATILGFWDDVAFYEKELAALGKDKK